MSVMIQCAVDLAVLTGLRPADLLHLTRGNLADDGIEIETSKTGKRILIEWSEALRSAVKRTLAAAPQVRQPIVCNLQTTRQRPPRSASATPIQRSPSASTAGTQSAPNRCADARIRVRPVWSGGGFIGGTVSYWKRAETGRSKTIVTFRIRAGFRMVM
jgi:integrase